MRIARTFIALLLFSSLILSCTVDPIDQDDSINQIEDVLATGENGEDPPPPPPPPPGENG